MSDKFELVIDGAAIIEQRLAWSGDFQQLFNQKMRCIFEEEEI